MSTTSIPSLEEFLALPAEQVVQVAPATVVFAVGGTRRSAALAGVAPHSDAYAHWLRVRMVTCIELFFRLGVRHLFTTAIRPGQVAEVGPYRERLMQWNDWGLAGPEALADYARLGWRVRLLGTESIPELRPAAERLLVSTPDLSPHTLWWYVVPDRDLPWRWILEAAQRTHARTREEAIRALYGEDIPLASLYLGFGKLMMAPDILPPLLADEIQCYWPQRPGYELDEQMLRRVFYDYAYLRSTWRANRGDRYEDLGWQRAAWRTDAVIGVGRRLGDFWYPAAFPEPPISSHGE
ncbi:MAG: hypothetical protein ACJ8CR_38990 [Roseiflexaceae bacterium]